MPGLIPQAAQRDFGHMTIGEACVDGEVMAIDEETAHLLDLESRYKAAATLLGKIQELLDELINAVR